MITNLRHSKQGVSILSIKRQKNRPFARIVSQVFVKDQGSNN